MKILVSGGAGFIGFALVCRLVKAGNVVRVLDNFSPQVHPNPDIARSKVQAICELVDGDIRSEADWLQALDGIDSVVHLAAETGVGQSMYQISKHSEVNITGLAKMLQVLVNYSNRVSRIVLASSRAVYGEGSYGCKRDGIVFPETRTESRLSKGLWESVCPLCGGEVEALATDEQAPKQPGSVYAVTKSTQEDLLECVGRARGISTAVLRYFNVYGEHQALNNPYTGILTTFFTQMKHGKQLMIYEDGAESRDFVHVSDVALATELALKSDKGGVFNVGSGHRKTIYEVAKEILHGYGVDAEPAVTGEYRLGDIRHCFADITRTCRELGYKPQISFSEGIRRFITWADLQLCEDNTGKARDELALRGLLGQAAGKL